jgi:outer membrane protein OmpA-like peptidoglycan-associated protein
MKRLSILFCLMLLSFQVIPARAGLPGFMLEDMGTLSGQLFVNDKPLTNAIIAFFPTQRGLPPISMEMRSIPEFLGQANGEGKFSIKLLAGNYFLGMLIRENNKKAGPPMPGEPFYFAAEPSGALRQFKIGNRELLEVGRVDGAKPETFKEASDTFTIKGAVVDAQGQPYPNVLVFAKTDMSQPRPDFISERTGEDGLFTIRLPAGRNYYLFARPNIGFAKPSSGDPMGVYGIKSANGLISPVLSGAGGPPPGVIGGESSSDNSAKPITGASQEVISGLEIVMYKIPNAEELKSSLQGKDTSPMFEQGANLNNIYFARNSARLEERSFTELDKWATFLNGSPDISLEISGHTDNTGTPAYNRTLSQKRAAAVALYLHGKGVDSKRITTFGFGPDQPAADNASKEGREKNRRVEIRFVQ